jgi:hypothetical protein
MLYDTVRFSNLHAARHTTLFCGCTLLAQRNTTCQYRTRANSCHYIKRLLSKHEILHTLHKTRVKLESHLPCTCIHPVVPKHEDLTIFSIFPKPLLITDMNYTATRLSTHHLLIFRTQRRSVWVPNKYAHAGSKVISQVASTSTLYQRARPNVRYELRSEAYFQEVQTPYITFLSLTRLPARGP